MALTAQAEQLTRREAALTALAQSLTEDQRRTHAARQAQDAYRTAAAAQDAAHAGAGRLRAGISGRTGRTSGAGPC